ncbi:hypothetical protein DM01DRAFT_1384246 [Hesseltinella vesiculosa]|uniref:LAG1-DNAbind-domain-containing protein n=1 Tax=Hesseltinella vesiculosa TaxID=101127 RepID=A0A1X2GFM2_9FUNG|nr:hypothetical protein DM01DRAFT_1384246 [Hesseltinella vesiculosa]
MTWLSEQQPLSYAHSRPPAQQQPLAFQPNSPADTTPSWWPSTKPDWPEPPLPAAAFDHAASPETSATVAIDASFPPTFTTPLPSPYFAYVSDASGQPSFAYQDPMVLAGTNDTRSLADMQLDSSCPPALMSLQTSAAMPPYRPSASVTTTKFSLPSPTRVRPNLTLDMNTFMDSAQQQLPMTPNLFSPTFAESLDEIVTTTSATTTNSSPPLQSPPALDMMCTSSSSSATMDIALQRRRSSNLSTASSLSESLLSSRTFATPDSGKNDFGLYNRYLVSLKEEEDTMQQKTVRMPASAKRSLSTGDAQKPAECVLDETTMKRSIQYFLSSAYNKWMDKMSVTIMTSRVAQKSYGTEKRFLCPPPIVLLTGSQWWTLDASAPTDPPVLQPPIIHLHMSSESVHGEMIPMVPSGQVEWTTSSGESWNRLEDAGQSVLPASLQSATPIIAGKCMSKNMYICDSDDKRKSVQMVAHLRLANGIAFKPFLGRDIRVISKPSKKRQTIKNLELCIHHGSVISLFNRIRSQTISTRYLGVSKTNGEPLGLNEDHQTDTSKANVCFTSRTRTWDPFVIWIVDGKNRQAHESHTCHRRSVNAHGSPPTPMPSPTHQTHRTLTSWPPPPAMALPQRDPAHPLPVYYNQPIVLQCLSTGLVSPVMIIRKVDSGTCAQGCMRASDFGHADRQNALGGEYHDELLGDPVSQLHKVAFQIVPDPTTLTLGPSRYHQLQKQSPSTTDATPLATLATSPSSPTANASALSFPLSTAQATYLSCMKNIVGIYRTSGFRQPLVTYGNKAQPQPPKPSSIDNSLLQHSLMPTSSAILSGPISTSSTSSASTKVTPDAAPTYASPLDYAPYGYPWTMDDQPLPVDPATGTTHLHKRRVSVGGERKSSKMLSGRRRYSSASENWTQVPVASSSPFAPRDPMMDHRQHAMKKRRNTILSSTSPSAAYPCMINHWQEEVSETCLWTIVNTDVETYSFLPEMLTTGPLRPSVMSAAPKVTFWQWLNDRDLVVFGHGFTKDMVIWFGVTKASMISIGGEELQLTVPPSLLQSSSRDKLPMLIVRSLDGMVYDTRCYLDVCI